MRWYFQVLKNYAKFEGRARRAEYWSFVFLNVVIECAAAFVAAVLGIVGSSILSGPGDHVMETGEVVGILVGILYNLLWLFRASPSQSVGCMTLAEADGGSGRQ
jgi:uncharacterized membrane protein YhaH (DUF805 family)